VLRITRINQDGAVLLRLEGKLLAAWVGELSSQVPASPRELDSLRLDLSQLIFVDSTGAALLHQLIDRGAVIEKSSPFVAELLHPRRS